MCHATHIGMEGCLQGARESMYWLHVTADIKDYRTKCDDTHPNVTEKETLLQQWVRVGVDLCDLHGRTLLVVCNYSLGT